MKRAIIIQHNDETPNIELEIGRVAAINTESEFIYIEKMSDGKWRLTYSSSIFPDFSKVDAFKILREQD